MRNAFQMMLLLILTLVSCSENFKDKINGIWAIDGITENNADVSIFNFNVNTIIFEKNGICQIPLNNSLQNNAIWIVEVEKGQDIVTITSDSPYLEGRFYVYFSSPNNRKMILKSKNRILFLSKII